MKKLSLAAGLLLSLLSARAAATGLLLGAGGSTAAPATCSINLDFTVAGGSLPAGVTMTGAANATHYASTGIVTTSGTNVARFDYNPTSLALRGLLVEPAKTNALVHGRPDTWATANLNTLAAVTDPTGGTNAARYSEDTSNAEHHLSLNIASWPVSSQAVTFSFYVRNNSGARFLTGNFANSSSFTGFVQAGMNPTSGVKDFGPTVGGNWSAGTGGTVQTINISGNVWFRVSFGATVAASATLQPDMVWTTDAPGSVFSYTGDGTSGFQLFGFQASKDSEKTLADSFIDTGGSATAVSTTADAVSFSNPVCTQLLFTFDDNSTQLVTGITPGTYTIPTNLNRPWIKTIVGAVGCSQATTFLARTSGLNAAHQNAYTTMICGLVTDGVWTTGDVFYVFATADATTAGLNLISLSFAATVTGAPTFTADSGYVGGTLANHLGTYNPVGNATNFTQNSAAVAEWGLTNSNNGSSIFYNSTISQEIGMYPRFTDGRMYASLNSADDATGVAVSRADGFKSASRVASTGYQYYDAGVNLGTHTATSTAIFSSPILIAGGASSNNNTNNIAVFWIGGGLSDPQETALYNRIHAYMQTIAGVP